MKLYELPRKFTLRDITCGKVIACDGGDVILQDCSGDKVMIYPEKDENGKPTKARFNLRLSKVAVWKLVKGLRDKEGIESFTDSL